ncbi:MAG: substrate-binding domain-containing protein, partial [Chloroflexi bacterium]|nr:substrate-binding domain-containing protein [Chloroflexota bacterium]
MSLSSNRRTIGILPAYQVYGNLPGYLDYEGTSITDYLLHLMQGALAAAHDLDCNVLIGCGMGHTYQMGRPFPAWYTGENNTTFVPLGPWNTDGLIVIPPLLNDNRSHQLAELRRQGFPVVFTGTGEPPPFVMTDASTIALAVRHLREHGHRRIAFLAGYPPTETRNDSSDRLTMYKKTIKECGLELDESLIAYGYHNVPSGRAAMQSLLAMPAPATAVICSDYSSALGALQAIHEANLRIPEEIALIAYDDFADAWAQEPPLTTGHQRNFDLGYEAVSLLLDYIEGRCTGPTIRQLSEQLILRQSCGCELTARLAHAKASTLTSGWQEAMAMQASSLIWEATLRISKNELDELCRMVMQGWQQSTQNCASPTFLGALEKLINRLCEAGEDPQIINFVFGILYTRYPGAIDEVPRKMLEQAQALTLMKAKHYLASRNYRGKTEADYLGIMTARLQNALNEFEILEILLS